LNEDQKDAQLQICGQVRGEGEQSADP
jgi:hypothetical protein